MTNQNNVMFNFIKLFLLLETLIFISSCTDKKNNFYVHNKDVETIDSLHIYVGNDTYLIEDIQPKRTKGIRIQKMGGKQISLQADKGKNMALSSVVHPPFRGTHRLIITKNRIISESSFSN